jgi:probable phosphoglycerate mutase
MRLILIRHGETGGNPTRRLQGRVDLPLSGIGRAQARAAAEALKGEALDRLVASNMKRASETAGIIAACQSKPVPVVLDSRLREVDLGLWEGLTLDEVREKFPGELERWFVDPQAVPPQGEPAAETRKRISLFADELLSSGVQTAAVVAHLLVFQVLISTLMDITPATRYAFHLSTGSLSELRIRQGRTSLLYLNRLSHLAAAGLDVESLKDR